MRSVNFSDIIVVSILNERQTQHCRSKQTTMCDEVLRCVVVQAEQKKRKVWKLVLTGGPCGGKTTGQARLSTFFENLGWKVYR